MEQVFEVLRPFAKMVAEELATMMKPPEKKEPRIVRGLSGIMEIFQCGQTKAQQIRKSGIIDDAITTSGRVLLVDVDKALELMHKYKGGRKYESRR